MGRGYFISDGRTYTWGEIHGHIVNAVGKRAVSVSLPSFVVPLAARAAETLTRFDNKPRLLNRQKAVLGAQNAWVCTNEAAQQDLGFRTRTTMAAGMRATYRWYVDNGWL